MHLLGIRLATVLTILALAASPAEAGPDLTLRQAANDFLASRPTITERLAAVLNGTQSRPDQARAVVTTALDRQGREALDAIPWAIEEAEAKRFFSDEFFSMPGDDTPALREAAAALLAGLAPASPAVAGPVEVHVLGDSVFEAFGKGGGIVVLGDGILSLPRGEATAILAHEIAHLETRDYLRQMISRILSERILHLTSEDRRPAASAFLQAIQNELSRGDEFDADARAARMLASTPFGSKAMRDALLRTTPSGGSSGLSDHPSLDERLQHLTVLDQGGRPALTP